MALKNEEESEKAKPDERRSDKVGVSKHKHQPEPPKHKSFAGWQCARLSFFNLELEKRETCLWLHLQMADGEKKLKLRVICVVAIRPSDAWKQRECKLGRV